MSAFGGNNVPTGLCIVRPAAESPLQPLETVLVLGGPWKTLLVTDGHGREYFRALSGDKIAFAVGGSLGTHTIRALDEKGCVIGSLTFQVDARTHLEDQGGLFQDLFAILNKTMRCYSPDGTGSIQWRGKTYRHFVHWILDHSHTAKGMQYFDSVTAGLADLFREAQKKNGMIWSFAFPEAEGSYHESAYAPFGYAWSDGGVLFGRQPVENHNEANFVDTVYLAWKGSGDDAWMAGNLDAAVRALDYSATDRARWSAQYRLLKRGYTIDSWDFQPEDQYLVRFRLGTAQMIDPERTQFGVFFGDNTAYAQACDQLAEMLQHSGRAQDAAKYRQRAAEIRRRLTELSWNGRFFTHHVAEDTGLKRDLGVDEKSQIAMSNAYSINRGIPHEQCVAILRTYQDLREHLPPGSPGEWYAIYPPFERGFGKDSQKWQYMNAGVHGHAAGELARGAFEHGFERYGADILRRLCELGRKHGRMVRFAYTGAYEPPPPPQKFTPMNIASQANMDLWDKGAQGVPAWMATDAGNDMRNLPVGRQTFAGVTFDVPDPEKNGRRGAIAVAHRAGFPEQVEVPLAASETPAARAGALYLLHTAGGIGPSKVAGAVTLRYSDGAEHTTYILAEKHLAGWWFPNLKSDSAGVAWRGPNQHSTDVGVSWAVLANPHPEKEIRSLQFAAAKEGALYAVLGVTLADRLPHVAADPVSFGGPDNWAGGTCMLALIQGLAGVLDAGTAFGQVRLSPRWAAAKVPSAAVTTRYPASKGYVSYRYRHDSAARKIEIVVTGSGERAGLRILLPPEAKKVASASVNGSPVQARLETIEGSTYALMEAALCPPATVQVDYAC